MIAALASLLCACADPAPTSYGPADPLSDAGKVTQKLKSALQTGKEMGVEMVRGSIAEFHQKLPTPEQQRAVIQREVANVKSTVFDAAEELDVQVREGTKKLTSDLQ